MKLYPRGGGGLNRDREGGREGGVFERGEDLGYLSVLLCICPFIFETNLNKTKQSIYGNFLPVFSTGSRYFSVAVNLQITIAKVTPV